MNFSGISSKTILGKILRSPLKLIPTSARMPIIQGPLRGKKWIAGSSNHGCWLGSYENEMQARFSAAIRPGDTVYDLGAHVGFYSLLASVLAGPEGKVFSFEPVAQNLKYLHRHLELNRVDNCFVWDVAVGSSEGWTSFDSGPTLAQGYLTAESNGAPTVRTVTLDGLVASGKLRPPNLIKCDIEGGEYDALSGASGILEKYGPTIFLSTHGIEMNRRCCNLLEEFHYHLTSLTELPLDQTHELMATRRET